MRIRFIAAVLCCWALSAAYGQSSTGQITGKITDPSAAAVPGALVAVTNVDTGMHRETSTNELGSYAAPLLPPGNYRVQIQKEGFRPVNRSGVTLAVDQVARIDVVMEVGAVAETIEVVAAPPLLAQETSALGQVVDNTKIVNIPLNGRSPFRLVQLTPGILSAPSSNGQFGDMPVNTTWDANFSINGGRLQSNEIQIDGVPSTAGFFNQVTTIPTVEAAQEFKVQSNNLSAEWGRFAGGAINVSTRSGANVFHGSVYEFLRNSAADANEFFNNRAGRPIPAFRMNQFGGAAGGPVVIPTSHTVSLRPQMQGWPERFPGSTLAIWRAWRRRFTM